MKSLLYIAFLLLSLFLFGCRSGSLHTIELKPLDTDMTPVVRALLEDGSSKNVKIVFPKGRYDFHPDKAFEKFCFITNHDNGQKKVAFLFEDFESVEIEGNGSEFIFHGQIFPFQFENCAKVTVSNLSVDWEIPFLFQGEVVAVNEEEGYRDLRPFTEGFSWRLENGKLLFPGIDGFSYKALGATLPFYPDTKRVTHGAFDANSDPSLVEELPEGILRFHEKLKKYPPVGSILNSKGDKGENRYAPAFHAIASKNVRFENVIVHHAPGMGFLAERTENVTLSGCGVYLSEGSERVVSSTADATHFCNCKGDIVIENCRFENMLDDGTNVHGTYVEVAKLIDERTVRVALMHFQQQGFTFAGPGDVVWFLHRPSHDRVSENTVQTIRKIDDETSEIVFDEPIPKELKLGDLLENQTWNPNFTMRDCVIRDHRARNVVLKTPKKIVIENNQFSSMMSSIFFRGETYFWFESGAVGEVLIRNNEFEYCAYSGAEHAVLYITPRSGQGFDSSELYDRNIRFEQNKIKTFDNRIVWADRVDGLVIKDNQITQTSDYEPMRTRAHLFDFTHCRNVEISNNSYVGSHTLFVRADADTKQSLVVGGNTGF